MATPEKPKSTSGYPEQQPKPSPDGNKQPCTGTPQESQNMPKDKPGKGSSP
jgi:hypothetical protein